MNLCDFSVALCAINPGYTEFHGVDAESHRVSIYNVLCRFLNKENLCRKICKDLRIPDLVKISQ